MFSALLSTPTELLVWAIVAHLAADWLFQTEWMARYKVSLKHPASWAHAGVYALFMALVFPPFVALLIGAAHLLVDTRVPVEWWLRTIKGLQRDAPGYRTVLVGVDQTIHVFTIAVAALALAVW